MVIVKNWSCLLYIKKIFKISLPMLIFFFFIEGVSTTYCVHGRDERTVGNHWHQRQQDRSHECKYHFILRREQDIILSIQILLKREAYIYWTIWKVW